MDAWSLRKPWDLGVKSPRGKLDIGRSLKGCFCLHRSFQHTAVGGSREEHRGSVGRDGSPVQRNAYTTVTARACRVR